MSVTSVTSMAAVIRSMPCSVSVETVKQSDVDDEDSKHHLIDLSVYACFTARIFNSVRYLSSKRLPLI